MNSASAANTGTPGARPGWCVQGLVQGPESDAALAKSGDDRDQILQRPAEPIQRGHHEGVPRAQVVQAAPQLFALDVLAGLLVREDFLASGRGERVELAVEQLPCGRDPGVADEGPAAPIGSRASPSRTSAGVAAEVSVMAVTV